MKHFNDFEKNYNKDLTKGFSAKFPKITVKIDTPQTGAVFAKFQTLAAGGNPPTVYLANLNYWPSLQANGMIQPLDLNAMGYKSLNDFKSQYIDSATAPWIIDGKIYGVPEEVSNYQTWVNKQYFTDAGLQIPKTWDDVCSAAAKINVVKGSKVERTVIDIPTNFPDGLALILDAVAREFGGHLFSKDGTQAFLTSTAVVNEFKMFQHLVECGAYHPELNGSTTAMDRILYGQGTTAMMLTGGSWYAGSLQTQYPKVWKQSTVAPYPTVEGHKPENDIYGYAYVVPKKSSSTPGVWDYMNYLKDQGETAFKLGLYSGLNSLAATETAKSTPFWQDKWVPSLQEGQAQPLLLHASQIYDILNQAFGKVVLSKADPAAALKDAQAQIMPLLNPKK